MSLRDHKQAAPDFTDAFLGSFGVLVFLLLCFVTALGGYVCTAIAVWIMSRMIDWLARRRGG